MISSSERQSNIELCRIVSMFLVVLVHSNFAWTGYPNNGDGVARFFIQAFSIIGVNVFVLISGWFSVSLKIRNILNLIYICLFYAVVRIVYGIINESFYVKDIFFISNSNWFVVSYIGLLLFSPMVNMVGAMNKNKLKYISILLIVYEVWFSFFPSLSILEPGFNHGYSVCHFLVLYILARYMRIYGIPSCVKKYSFWIYISCSILLGFLSYIIFVYQKKERGGDFIRMYDYNNPIVILSSISFFVTFVKISIGNKKWINYISKSMLGVLLLHGSSAINPSMKAFFLMLLEKYSQNYLILCLLWILGVFGIFFICIFIDQVRIITYKLLINKILSKYRCY